MKIRSLSLLSSIAALVLLVVPGGAWSASSLAEELSKIQTPADLEALIASTDKVGLKMALQDGSDAILAAVALRPHLEAVLRMVEGAPGSFETTNKTPVALKMAVGGALPLFDTLHRLDLAVTGAGAHAHRTINPYDPAFFEHLSHLHSLTWLNVRSTKADDTCMPLLAKLTNLTTLKIANNGKLSDAGLESLAEMRQLEYFNFVGTSMTGKAFSKFEGWTNLKRSSFRGSSLDDAGLRLLCERFPNYESLSLAHAKFTNAGAIHLSKLTHLRRLEIGSHNASPECLGSIVTLPLEYLQIGDGLDTPEGIALIKDIPTLRQLTLIGASALTDADLKLVADMTQLEHLELGRVEWPNERLPLLKNFAFLKSLRLVPPGGAYPPEMQDRIKALLPKVDLQLK
ncbi:MAG: hypothetical protein ACI97B_002047 [Verrucomicrobiales bacterium]|jgi:hypothetical protein